MARRLRADVGGVVYHVINRRVGRGRLFDDDGDYQAFEKVLGEAVERFGMRLVCYCLMPNHWHLVVWPRKDGQLRRFMQWLTVTHMRRWHAHRNSAGTGPVYQGRFKSFPMQTDEHFAIVCRYVERNALRAGLVEKAERWAWSSLGKRESGEAVEWLMKRSQWPAAGRRDWVRWVNEAETSGEIEALRVSVNRGRPFGEEKWVRQMAGKLKLESSLRDPWRPKKAVREAARGSGKKEKGYKK